MKLLYPLITILVISSLGITALAIANLNNNNDASSNQNSKDKIIVNSVNITDPGYECITTPCSFRTVTFDLKIVNSFEKTINYICLDEFSLIIKPGNNQADTWWKTDKDMIKAPCTQTNITIPIGTWNDSYTTTLYLSKMPNLGEEIPMEINVQVILGNNQIVSPVFSINLDM